MSVVGSLMYSMVCTRLVIAHAVGVVSMYMNNPGKENWKTVQWILRYLRGITSHALCFGVSDIVLHGYVDADMVGDKNTRRITTWHVLTIGGTTVGWISNPTIAPLGYIETFSSHDYTTTLIGIGMTTILIMMYSPI